MPGQAAQGSRFELKYLISENCARSVRDFARSFLVPDRFAVGRPNNEYPVCSLYLDSHDLALCQATQQGRRNRFKLRIRFYDDIPASPAWFEIKRRQDSIILKKRAAVKRTSLRRLLERQVPMASDLLSPRGNELGALQEFCRLSGTVAAGAKVFVHYNREAYVSPENNSLRVTFDRRVMTARYESEPCPKGPEGWFQPPLHGVILEIKFTNRFPDWVGELIRTFNLERRSVAKYVLCAHELLRPLSSLGHQPRLGWSRIQETQA